MLSFLLRRALLRPAMLSPVQILSTRPILSNRFLALSVKRGLATTFIARDAESTPTSKPKPAPKSKPKSTRKKSASSAKAPGKRKEKKPAKRGAKKAETKKAETKKKITISPEDKPPKSPGSSYTLWFTEWCREQPKVQNIEGAQSRVKEAAQIWHTISDDEKQRYREKYDGLQAEYKRRMDDWREQVDPRILKELNRRRAAKGRPRIRGRETGRPLSGFFRYLQHVREEYARTEDDGRTYVKAMVAQGSSQWKAMSDAEKAKYNDPARADFAAWREKRKAESQAKQ